MTSQPASTDDTPTELVPLPSEAEIRADYFAAELSPAALDGDAVATLILASDDLRLAHFTEQVVAALHGDPRVLDLPPEVQEQIARLSRAFEVIAGGILRDRDPAETRRRAALMLDGEREQTAAMFEDSAAAAAAMFENSAAEVAAMSARLDEWASSQRLHAPSGPPMRCPQCQRIHHPLTGPADWGIAGREDIACPSCLKAAPRHAANPDMVKVGAPPLPRPARKRTTAATPRKRAPRRKPAGGAA